MAAVSSVHSQHKARNTVSARLRDARTDSSDHQLPLPVLPGEAVDAASASSKKLFLGRVLSSRRKLHVLKWFAVLVTITLVGIVHTHFLVLHQAAASTGFWPIWGPPVSSSAWSCATCGCPGFDSDAAAVAGGCMPSSRLRAIAELDNWPRLQEQALWPAAHSEKMDAVHCYRAAHALANSSSRKYAAPATIRPAYAGDIPPSPLPNGPRIIFHIYVRLDLEPLGKWHADAIGAVLVSQPRSAHVLIWSPDAAVGSHPLVQAFVRAFPDRVAYRVYEATREAVGTPLEASWLITNKDPKGWIDSDLFRLVVLYHYGGVYIDTDMILRRDITPLLGFEWATEIGCNHPIKFNNAIMRMHRRSKAIETIASRAGVQLYRPKTWTYGPDLLHYIYDQSQWFGRPPLFHQTPWCFFSSRWCEVGGVTISQQAGTVAIPAGVEDALFGLHYHSIYRETTILPGSLLYRWDADINKKLDEFLQAQDPASGSWASTLQRAIERSKTWARSGKPIVAA